MSALLPAATSVGDLCKEAIKECGAIGVGQTPLADDVNDAWIRLQWMLQEWQNDRFLVYHNVIYLVTSTGALNYSIGPSAANIPLVGMRPPRIESAFLRQLTQSQPNQIDYPMELLQSMEDYADIALKGLVSFPGAVFYDPTWPNGTIYPWPVPQANIYAVGVVVREQLPTSFANLAVVFNIPFNYYSAIVYNLALLLKSKYGIPVPQGDTCKTQALNSLKKLRGANNAIKRLRIPGDLNRPGIYNIFSDRMY